MTKIEVTEIRFTLNDDFLHQYKWNQPNWGPLGYITYKRTYARDLGGGKTEEFWQTLKRVVEGVFTIQQRHCAVHMLPWSPRKAQATAQKMYKMMWEFKFSPPGRGLWMMGTDYVLDRGGAALNNCGFVSTENINIDFAEPFAFLMDMSMLGVGVGGDTKGAGTIMIKEQKINKDETLVVEDTREGWVNLMKRLLKSFSGEEPFPEKIDYSLVRKRGEPIRGFGGTSSGPEPLVAMIKSVGDLLTSKAGNKISSTDIVDIFNLIGKCVVAGNVRRCLLKGTKVLTNKGWISIENVKKSDKVLTANGYKQVKSRINSGKQHLLKIITKNETNYEVTDKHTLLVYNKKTKTFKWKMAKNIITDEDYLVKPKHLNSRTSFNYRDKK